MSSYRNAIIKVGQSLLLDMGEPNKPGGKASKVFPQRRSACMQRFPGAAESDTGCSDPELCERCSAECGNEHAAECSRVRQSAAGSAVAAAVVQQSWVQPAAAAGLRPLQSTPGRGCSPLCSRARPRLGCGLRRRLQLGWRPAMLLQASCTHPAVLHTTCSCCAMHLTARPLPC